MAVWSTWVIVYIQNFLTLSAIWEIINIIMFYF